MKKLFLLLLPVVIFACQGVEQYRSGIETLSSEWDATTVAVTDFTNALNGDLQKFTQFASATRLSEDVQKALKPEQIAEWQNAERTFTQALQKFAPIRTQVTEFTKAWTEKGADVKSLLDGLAAKKFEGDVAGKISELSTLVAQAKDSLTNWQAAHAEAQTETQTAADGLKALYDNLSASVVAGKK